MELRAEAMRLLQEEADLEEIVRLVGIDALSQKDRLTLETARSIREDFLHQNAFHEIDTYASMQKQYKLLKLILKMHELSQAALEKGVTVQQLSQLPVKEEIARAKFTLEHELHKIDEIAQRAEEQVASLIK